MALKSGKLFDIHVEIGLIGQDFYAKTVLNGPNGVMFEQFGSTPAVAVGKLAADLEQSSMWAQIAQAPQIAGYPFNAPVKAIVKIDPNAPKQRPSDIHNMPHPDCTAVCQAYDNFLDAKCASICGHRKGV